MIDKFEPGDVLLIKASRAEHLEVLADEVKKFLHVSPATDEAGFDGTKGDRR